MNNRIILLVAGLCLNLVCANAQLEVTLVTANTTPTVLTFDVMVRNTGAVPIKLAALTNVYALPTGTGAPIVSWVEDPLFAPLANPSTGYTAPRVRAVQGSPVGEPSAVTVPTTSTLFGKMTLTFATPQTFPMTLTPVGTTPNPTMQALVYTNGATVSNTLAVSANTITVSATPLPIELISFDAKVKGQANEINWVTGAERNTASHVIERSKDGVGNWILVGKVAAAGFSSAPISYNILDPNPFSLTHYRLRSVDFDGNEERSNIVSVQRKASGVFGVTAVYPSPTADNANVQFEANEEATVTIQVFDFTGRMVLEQQLAALKGTNVQSVNMSSLAAGVYSLQVRTDNEISAQVKVVKQ
jgi:hypothetical protein